MKINYACSLGQYCHTAELLKQNNFKFCSYPFDWIPSNFNTILHCIEDEFKIFLDKSYYINISYSQRGHKFYDNNMFFHHDPLGNAEHYEYFVRCVDRFKNLLNQTEHKLFTMLFINMEKKDDKFKENIIDFNNKFSRHTSNYTLLVILHVPNKKDNYHEFTYDNNIHFLELHTLSSSNGLKFNIDKDNEYLNNVIKQTYN